MVKSLEMLYVYNYIFIKNLILHGYCHIKEVDTAISSYYELYYSLYLPLSLSV